MNLLLSTTALVALMSVSAAFAEPRGPGGSSYDNRGAANQVASVGWLGAGGNMIYIWSSYGGPSRVFGQPTHGGTPANDNKAPLRSVNTGDVHGPFL